MHKGYLFCGSVCAFLGVLGIIFAVGAGEWFVLSVARQTIRGMTVSSFDKMRDGFESCSAYEKDYDYPFASSKRKWKESDFEDDDEKAMCVSRSRTHYYVYHLTNEQQVLGGATPIVEQRGPWVFKSESRGYTLERSEDGESTSGTSRSWRLLDEAATKKLCPKCATDKLCVAWDYSKASSTKWPTSCTKGTRAGDATYNAITHPNPGYIGLLNLLELIPGADERFIVYLFGSQTITQLFGPGGNAVQYTNAYKGGAANFFSGNCSTTGYSLSSMTNFQSAGMVYPVELSCFLLLPNQNIGASAADIPRTLTYKDDLDTWNPDKQKQILWFINGANMTNGNPPIKTAAKYAGLPMGWTGLRWTALSQAYAGLKAQIPYSTAAAYGTVRPNGGTTPTFNQICNGGLQTALETLGDLEAKAAFDPLSGKQVMTCAELETLVSYTHYIAEKFAMDGKVRYPSCDQGRLTKNGNCESSCKAYKGCKETPRPSDDKSDKLGWLNCSTSNCESFKPCYFNQQNFYGGANGSNPLADQASLGAYTKKGGLFFTLEAQSIFNGYTDSIIVLLEDMLGIDAGSSSRSNGIVWQKNTPYQDEDTFHDDACWEHSAFVDVLKEEGPRKEGGDINDCDKTDAERVTAYNASAQGKDDKHLKPCRYKAKSYYSSDYSLKKAGADKLLQVRSVGGNEKVKGLKNRKNPFGQYMMAQADTWGEEVKVEGYRSNVLPALLAESNDGPDGKMFYELQDKDKSADDVLKMMSDANKENENLFQEQYKMWTGPLERTTTVEFEKMVTLSGEKEDTKLNARRFSPKWFTRFTAKSTSSDLIGGANKNPKCLVNLKKRDQVDLYVGNKNFHGCDVDSTTDKFTRYDGNVSSSDIVLLKAKIVNENNKEIETTGKDKLYLDVEPVTGMAVHGNIASGVYLKVGGNTPVYSPKVKEALIPYFSTVTTTSATKEEVDRLYQSINLVPYMLDLLPKILYSVGCVFAVLGGLMIFMGLCKSSAGSKGKSGLELSKI